MHLHFDIKTSVTVNLYITITSLLGAIYTVLVVTSLNKVVLTEDKVTLLGDAHMQGHPLLQSLLLFLIFGQFLVPLGLQRIEVLKHTRVIIRKKELVLSKKHNYS